MTTTETVILGIGNTLLSDEGVGVQLIDFIKHHSPRIAAHTLVDGGTLSFTLAGYLADATRLVVIDAAELDKPAGTVQVFEGPDMDRFAGRTRRSVHSVGLADLLAIAHLGGHVPVCRALVAIQPLVVDWGQQLSAPLQAARQRVVREIELLLERWDAQHAECGVQSAAGAGC